MKLWKKSKHYMDFIEACVNTWYKLIPMQERMVNFQCWYSTLSLPKQIQQWLMQWETMFINTDIYNEWMRKKCDNITFSFQRSFSHSNYFCVPKIILGGFPKAGTTYLYNIIVSHPGIKKPMAKEQHFWREFIHHPKMDSFVSILVYLYQYKRAAESMELATDSVVSIDGSASTVFSSAQHWVDINKDICIAPILLSRLLPHSKYIFILREPAERLWSDFWYSCSKKHLKSIDGNTSKFENIVNTSAEFFHNTTVRAVQHFKSCLSQNRSTFECVMKANSDVGAHSACKSVRLGLSIYYYHLVKWYGLIPRDHIFLLRFEDLVNDTKNSINGLWAFLELEELRWSDVQLLLHKIKKNSLGSWMKGVKSESFKMLPETRELLTTFFRPFNAKLTSLVNDNFFM